MHLPAVPRRCQCWCTAFMRYAGCGRGAPQVHQARLQCPRAPPHHRTPQRLERYQKPRTGAPCALLAASRGPAESVTAYTARTAAPPRATASLPRGARAASGETSDDTRQTRHTHGAAAAQGGPGAVRASALSARPAHGPSRLAGLSARGSSLIPRPSLSVSRLSANANGTGRVLNHSNKVSTTNVESQKTGSALLRARHTDETSCSLTCAPCTTYMFSNSQQLSDAPPIKGARSAAPIKGARCRNRARCHLAAR